MPHFTAAFYFRYDEGIGMQFKIFPYGIVEGEKTPLIPWRTESSNDPNVIKQWQEFFKDKIKGWGLPTGKVNGIWALDIDNKDGLNGYDSLKQLGVNELPHTAYQYTPSGGLHLFFKADNQSINYPTSVNVDLKLDTRGDGGFIWVYQPVFDLPIIEAPSWVWSVLKKKPKEQIQNDIKNVLQLDPGISLNRFNQAINLIRGAGVGERNHTLNTQSYVVGQLVAAGAVSKEYAYEELKKAAIEIGLTERESHHTITSGLTGGVNNPIQHPFDHKPEIAISIPDVPMMEPVRRWTPSQATLGELTDWSKLRKPQLFENWSSEDIILTSAIGGVGKTTLKIFEAVCLALGEPFAGFKCLKPGATLFIIGEDSEAKIKAMLGAVCKQLGLLEPDQKHRLEMVLQNIYIKLARDICFVAQNPKTRTFQPHYESLEKIYQAVDDIKPRQIVIDPIAMFWGPEGAGNDMFMALAKSMQELQSYSNASVDMIAHIGKDSYSKKDLSQFSSRGGSALPNHSRIVRTLLKLNENEYSEYTGEPLEEGMTAILVYVSKFSDGSPLLGKEFILLRNKYVFERKEINRTVERDETSSDKQRIYNTIKQSTEAKPMTLKYLSDYFYLQNPKINKASTRAIVTVLINEGLVIEADHRDETIGKWLRSAN